MRLLLEQAGVPANIIYVNTKRKQAFLIPDELWEKIEPLLPIPVDNHSLGTHRSRINNRAAMNGIFFVLRTGCQWNALNVTGICSSSSAHRRFLEWVEASVFEDFWKHGLLAYDEIKGLDWSWLSMDGAVTKAPLSGTKIKGPNPTDRAKQGVKRSLLTEGSGIPIALVIDGANRHDVKLFQATLENIEISRPQPTEENQQGLCLDKGYDSQEVREIARAFGFTAHVRSRGEEKKALAKEAGLRARRWVVERTHSWMNRFRRVLIRWEKRPDTYLAMLHFSCGIITWNAWKFAKAQN
jgi:putative transposase